VQLAAFGGLHWCVLNRGTHHLGTASSALPKVFRTTLKSHSVDPRTAFDATANSSLATARRYQRRLASIAGLGITAVSEITLNAQISWKVKDLHKFIYFNKFIKCHHFLIHFLTFEHLVD
jgi:hypothetical protein